MGVVEEGQGRPLARQRSKTRVGHGGLGTCFFLYPCQRMSYHSSYSVGMKIEPVISFENLACDFGFGLLTVFPDGSANTHSSAAILRAVFQNILHHLFHDQGKISDHNGNQEQPQSPYHRRLVQGQRADRFAARLKLTTFSYGRI